MLIDIPWLRGLPYLPTDALITAHELDQWEEKTGVHIRSGDAVLVRTGRWAFREAKGPWDIANASAGLAPSAMAWLHQRDAAFMVSDCAHDAIPAPVEGVDFPIQFSPLWPWACRSPTSAILKTLPARRGSSTGKHSC